MTENSGEGSPPKGQISQKDLTQFKTRLDQLDERIETARTGARPDEPDTRAGSIGKAFRMATDLVAAVVVGAFIGWALDQWIGWEKPWMLILFFMLGFAAGMRNLLRTAQSMQAAAVKRHGIGVDIDDDPENESRT